MFLGEPVSIQRFPSQFETNGDEITYTTDLYLIGVMMTIVLCRVTGDKTGVTLGVLFVICTSGKLFEEYRMLGWVVKKQLLV